MAYRYVENSIGSLSVNADEIKIFMVQDNLVVLKMESKPDIIFEIGKSSDEALTLYKRLERKLKDLEGE